MKILIIQTAFIGDVILITPLIKAVKMLFPESVLDVLVIPQTYEILQHNPYINEILTFDKRKLKIQNFFKTIFLLRKRKYNIAILPHNSFTTGFICFASGVNKRIGFDFMPSSLLLTKRVSFIKGKHRIENNLDLISVFSDKAFDMQTELYPDERAYQKSEKLISQLDKKRKRIAIAPGSIWDTKCWLEEYYQILANKLIENGFSIILIGSPAERELCKSILPSKHAINLAGITTILESAAVIEKCDLMISNDNGALHLANAVKTDVFAFFGPTVKQFGFYPYRKNDKIFEVDIACRPCSLHGGKKCPQRHHNCMKLIKPKKVLQETKEFFNKK